MALTPTQHPPTPGPGTWDWDWTNDKWQLVPEPQVAIPLYNQLTATHLGDERKSFMPTFGHEPQAPALSSRQPIGTSPIPTTPQAPGAPGAPSSTMPTFNVAGQPLGEGTKLYQQMLALGNSPQDALLLQKRILEARSFHPPWSQQAAANPALTVQPAATITPTAPVVPAIPPIQQTPRQQYEAFLNRTRGNLPAPNQIVAREWRRLPQTTRDFLLGAYEAQGWYPEDIEYIVKQLLPGRAAFGQGRNTGYIRR